MSEKAASEKLLDSAYPFFITIDSIFIAGSVIGNLLILFTIWRRPRLHTPNMIFVVSIAFAHLMVGLILMPMHILKLSRDEIQSHFMCKAMSFIEDVAHTANPLSALIATINQFLDIMQLRTNPLTKKAATVQVATIWIFSAIYAVRQLYFIRWVVETKTISPLHNETVRMCEAIDEHQTAFEVFVLIDFIIRFSIPLLIGYTLHIRVFKRIWFDADHHKIFPREKREETITILIVLIAEFISEVPEQVTGLVAYFGAGFFTNFEFWMSIFEICAFIQSWLNVILIIIMNRTFREHGIRGVPIDVLEKIELEEKKAFETMLELAEKIEGIENPTDGREENSTANQTKYPSYETSV